MIGELLAELLTVLIQILILIVGGYAIQYIRAKIGEQNLKVYCSLAKTVVTAIEQTIGGGHGADKKQEAVQVLKNFTKGKLTDEQIDKIIEAAVYEMKQILKMNGLKQ